MTLTKKRVLIMSRIKFKASRRLLEGYRALEMSGDLEYNNASLSIQPVYDVINLVGTTNPTTRLIIHCYKDGTYEVLFDGKQFEAITQLKELGK